MFLWLKTLYRKRTLHGLFAFTQLYGLYRLIFGTVETSIMSIDSFRALDTTRVLAYETPNIFHEEDDYIKFFSTQFRTNRLSGGYIKGGILGAISMIKSRNLK